MMFELREVLEVPGVLPPETTLADGIIAEYPPKRVHEATTNTLVEQINCESLVGSGLNHGYQDLLDRQVAYRRRMDEADAALNAKWAGKTQDLLGMAGSLGGVPDAEALEEMFRRSEAAEEARQRNPLDDQYVQKTQKDLARIEAQRLGAMLRLEELKPDIALSNEIEQRYRVLGKRGRVATFIAGSLLSVGAFMGAYAAVGEQPKSEIAFSQMTPAQRHESIAESASHKSKRIMSFLPLGGIGVAAWVGSANNDRFARRRAKKAIARQSA